MYTNKLHGLFSFWLTFWLTELPHFPVKLWVYRRPHVKKSTMTFFLRILHYSLHGEIATPMHSPYKEPLPNRFFFSEQDEREIESVDDAWELVENGIELWREVITGYQSCEPLETLLEATSEHHVAVSFDGSTRTDFAANPMDLHEVSYLTYTQHDGRFADVKNHREWMEVTYHHVSRYVVGLSKRVEAAKNLYDRLIIENGASILGEGRSLVDDASRDLMKPSGSATTAQEAAFASVREYFVSTPDEILRIIFSNEGTIQLNRMPLYEAAMILQPLKDHFGLSKRRLFNVRVHVAGRDEFHWFDEKRTLHNNLKASRNSYGSHASNHRLKEHVDLFAKALASYLPPARKTDNSQKPPQL